MSLATHTFERENLMYNRQLTFNTKPILEQLTHWFENAYTQGAMIGILHEKLPTALSAYSGTFLGPQRRRSISTNLQKSSRKSE